MSRAVLLMGFVAVTLARPSNALPGGEGPLRAEPRTTRSALTVAATPVMSFATFSYQQSWRAFVGLEVGGRISLSDRWALGPFLRYAWEAPNRTSMSSTIPSCPAPGPCEGWSTLTTYSSELGAAGIAAHFHPAGGSFWIAPGVGGLMLEDATDERHSVGRPETSSWYHWGFEFSGSVGYDWHLGERFALTVSGRLAEAWFPWDEPVPPNQTASSGPLLAFAVGGWFGVE